MVASVLSKSDPLMSLSPADALHLELAEIDENLMHCPLSPDQEARAIYRRKEIYEALHPETKHGGDRRSEARSSGTDCHLKNDRFTAATAKATGKAERTIRAAAQRGAALARGAADPIFQPFSKRIAPGFAEAVERFLAEHGAKR